MELKQLKDLLRDMGVVGAGGAGFPTYAKLAAGVETIILNCAECEPLLKVHRQLLEEYTYEILSAFDHVVSATGAKEGIIAVKDHYHSTIEALEAELSEFPNLRICRLRAVYPVGDELILIKDTCGKTVAPGALPISVGVAVCNVESIYNAYRAERGHGVTHKFVTVAGEVKKPMTVRVPLGVRVSELVAAAGGVTCDDPAYISGGPMMGKQISTADVVTKTTNAILVLPSDHTVMMNKKRNAKVMLRRAMSVCCQCRSCTELCSRHVAGYPVEPHMVMRVLSNGGRGEIWKLAGSLYCSGCGLCETYSCPQDLSPKMLIDELKATAKREGFKPLDVRAEELVPDSEYKRVSLERLIMRLGLKKYDVPAPLGGELTATTVRIPLSQHIGVPSVPCVSEGDTVKVGDIIAKAPEGALGVNAHASVDGTVTAVGKKYIKIN